ncbi:MAG: hypothetical protein ABSD47_01085 [Candidatus Methylomirabilota bacterium]|jgi:hypothetical protein
MPDVLALQIVVDDKGTPAIKAFAQNLGSLKSVADASGAAVTTHAGGLVRLGQAAEGAGVSYRTLRMGVNDMALAMGTTSPVISQVALGLGHVVDRFQGASLGAKLFGGGIIAAGGAIAYFAAQSQETERVAERFAKIDQAVRALDMSALRSGIAEVNLEFDKMGRQGETWTGALKGQAAEVWRMLQGLKPAAVEARQALDALQAGMAKAVGLEMRGATAGHEATMAGLKVTSRQAGLQSYLSRGMAGENTIALTADAVKQLIQQETGAEATKLSTQLSKALAEAASRGTLEVEQPLISAKYKQSLEELYAKQDIKIAQVEEQARQQTLGVGEQRTRATQMGGELSAEQQDARVEALKQQMEASAKLQEEFKKNFNITGMFPTVDPLAKQLIEEEKTARLMAIDDTLKKNLSSVDQMKIADEDKAKLVGQADQTAEMQRANAIAEAVVKTNDLYDAVAKARDQVTGMAADVQTKLVGGIEAAAAAMKEVADNTEVIGMPGSAFQSKPGQVSDAWKKFFEQPKTGVGSEDWWKSGPLASSGVPGSLTGLPAGSSVGPQVQVPAPVGGIADWKPASQMDPSALPSVYAGASSIESYQEGGVIPGPVGRPRMAIVHGGETVVPRGGGAGRSGPAGPAVIDVRVGSAQLVRAVIPDLQRLIDDRSIRVS